jgi:hypothetical protein
VHPRQGFLLQGMHVAQHGVAFCLSPVSHISLLALRHIDYRLVLHASDASIQCCLVEVLRCLVGFTWLQRGQQATEAVTVGEHRQCTNVLVGNSGKGRRSVVPCTRLI